MNRDAGTTNPTYPYFFNKMDSKLWGNADSWNTNAISLGYVVDDVAQIGAIAQWVNGCGGACTNGHVAYVEQVGKQGSIVVSEYNFPETKALNHQFNVRTIPAGSKVFPQNFIHIPYVKLASNLLNFGDQSVNTASSQSVAVTNPTSEPILVAGVTITGTDKGDFTQTNTCGSSISPGQSCQITVTFTPMGQGPRSVVVRMYDTVVVPISQTITLTGSGI
jgi:surface antigen